MPGPISEDSKGPRDDAPYVPAYLYSKGPRVCTECGHHEGYHADSGVCLFAYLCQCKGLPAECLTPMEDM